MLRSWTLVRNALERGRAVPERRLHCSVDIQLLDIENGENGKYTVVGNIGVELAPTSCSRVWNRLQSKGYVLAFKHSRDAREGTYPNATATSENCPKQK